MNISVIITTHPELDRHLNRCLESVRWQLAPGDELLVVADGYRPLPAAVACYEIEKSGVAAARNYGAQRAVNPWLKFLDVDDLLAPFALNELRRVGDKIPAEYAVVAGGMMKVQDGLVAGYCPPNDLEAILSRVNPALVSACFVRRLAFGVGFDARIEFEEDWEFWLRLRADGWRFARLDKPVCYYWIDAAERAAKVRNHQVEGKDIRDYLKEKYGIQP